MDLKTASSSNMSKKKTSKSAFHGPASVVLGNIKHSGNKKDIALSKSEPSDSVYSNVDSMSDNDENVDMTDINERSLLGSAATTPKVKRVNTGAMFGSPLGSPNFTIDNDEIVLPPRLPISLEKKWINPKIIKTSVEVSIKKSFALDINLSAVKGNSAMVKTRLIRKFFSSVNGFGGTTTPSKFEGIIRSTLTSEESMEKVISLARENGIIVNTNLQKQGMRSDRAIVIKKIPIDTPKEIIVTAVSTFGEIKSIKIQLISMWQKAVVKFAESIHVAKAVGDHDIWVSRDWFRVLLFTLPVETIAHDLGTLLEKAGRKTCVINCSLETGNRFCCAVVGFGSVKELESAFLTESIFGDICLSWARLDLVWCGKCGHLSHSALECDAFVVLPPISSGLFKKPSFGANHLQLTRLYAKKNVPISCSAVFVVSIASSSGSFPSSSGFLSGGTPFFLGPFSPQVVSLNDCLVVLKHSLEILSDQVAVILKKLSFIELVPLVSSSCAFLLAASMSLAPVVDSDMALDDVLAPVDPPFSGGSESAAILSSSGSKVFTFKVGDLESKLSVLEALFGSILFVFDLFTPMNDLVWKMAICNVRGINIPAKQEDVVYWHFDSGNLISIIMKTKLRSSTRLWIVNKFNSVRIFSSGLDKSFHGAGVVIIMADFLACHVTKIEEVPDRVIVVHLLFKDKLSVSIIGLYAGVSSGICFGQAFKVNSVIAKAVNSSCFIVLGGDFNENGSKRSVSFKFCLGLGLSNSRGVKKTIDFIFVSESLASAVTDHKSWFKDCSSAKLLAVSGEFSDALSCADVNDIWVLLEKVLVDSADRIFSKHWFSEFQCSRNKFSSRFFRLELLVAKVVKGLGLGDLQRINQLINVWAKLDSNKTAMIANMIRVGSKSLDVLRQLSLIRKEYRKSKIYELKLAEEAFVRKAIECHIEKFCFNKGVMIRSVLDQPFHKVVLDHLVIGNDLVLEPDMVKLGVNEIMEDWTRKKTVSSVYAPLDYVRDNTFSDIICSINMNELLLVVNNLSDGKAAGLSGISNELWKHCDDMMARKILSKILLDHISLAYNKFRVLRGDNFLVLKGTSMQSLVFAIGSVVKDAIEKNREGVKVASLSISGLPISITKKGEAYCYLGIFLSTDEFSKPSLAKAHSDVRFFANVVLRKAITDKQFSYLVSAVLQPIVSYHTQFSFVLSSVCCKWDVMLRKSFKSKAGLSHDFPTETLCHPFLYGLKSFEQVQFKRKLAVLISFSNSFGILGHLFEHRFLDLHVLEWSLLNSLQFSVRLCVSSVNNFLAGVVKIFLCNELSLANNLPNVFCSSGHFLVSSILGSSLFFNSVCLLKWFGVVFGDKLFNKKECIMSWETFRCWKKLDPRGPAPCWFKVVSEFVCDGGAFLATSVESTYFSGLSILDVEEFSIVKDGLHGIWSGSFEAFMDGSVRNYGRADIASRVATYFSALDLSVGIRVLGLLSSTMAELQAIVLALECVPSFCTVVLYSDSQLAIDACVKVKEHFGIHDNVRVDAAAGDTAFSQFSLPVGVHEHFLVAENTLVSSNTRHFVWDLYRSICSAQWETGSGQNIISVWLVEIIDWGANIKVWHLNLYMLAGFTSRKSFCLCTYLIKAVHCQLSVVVRKWLYDKHYPGVLCLLCYEMELLDHVFMCSHDAKIWEEILAVASADWMFLAESCGLLSSTVLRFLDWCLLDIGLYSCVETMEIFDSKKRAVSTVIGFVGCFVELYHSKAWLIKSAYRVKMEVADLVGNNVLVSGLSHCASSLLSGKVVKMLGVINSFAVSFGHCRSCLFFSGLDSSPCVVLGV
ncbi:hypothetical protein G9A89_011879 [Geosiphon pyriformis]|nr:hypothetical protein G9A89_011879 [Geosiphon pyriformis]